MVRIDVLYSNIEELTKLRKVKYLNKTRLEVMRNSTQFPLLILRNLGKFRVYLLTGIGKNFSLSSISIIPRNR